MTTLVGLKIKDAVLIGSDSQVTSGNLRLPVQYDKVQMVGDNILIAGTGSVGNLQQVLKLALKRIYTGKILGNESPYMIHVSPLQLAEELGEINFHFPLEFKHYSPFAYLIGGYSDKNLYGISVGDDGSLIHFDSYYCDGSGSQLAYSLLQMGYRADLEMQEAAELLANVLLQVSNRDVYTDSRPIIKVVDKNGIKILEVEKKNDNS